MALKDAILSNLSFLYHSPEASDKVMLEYVGT